MFRQSRLRASILAFVILSFATAPLAFAQRSSRAQRDNQQEAGQDPRQRQRNVRPEAREVYRRWLEQDVAYIITDEERRAFRRLQTDDEREQFIEAFWRRRDPNPDTEENEYREEYYERIAHANQHFASGIPGWRTDRGRIYIAFGKPDSVESYPAGGPYDRPSYHGGGSTTTYPFEIWFYRHIPGIGSGIEIEFVDPTGTGEYRIARSPDEKDAMLHVPGAGMTLAEQLGLQSRAERISGLGGGGQGYQREQDNPFSRLRLLADLQRPPQVRFTDLADTVSTGVVEDNPLNFDIRIDFFRQSEDRVVTAFTLQTENRNLTFQDIGGVQTARMNIHARITSVAGRRAGIFEDPVIATATREELVDMQNRRSAYQRLVSLPPGTYKVDVVVRDVNSGATGIRNVGFTVPRYEPNRLATSTLVLASRLQSLSDQPAVGQFVIGDVKVIPNVSGTFRRGEQVGIYMQVYNVGIDQTTLQPAADVEYVVLRGSQELGRFAEDWRGMSDIGQRLTLARLLATEGLTAGEYEVQIRIRDRVSGQTLSPSAKFTIVE